MIKDNDPDDAKHGVEVVYKRNVPPQVHLRLDPEAVVRCLERDGALTVRFEEVGSTKLTDLVDAAVIVN
jgi:hypothetical protein